MFAPPPARLLWTLVLAGCGAPQQIRPGVPVEACRRDADCDDGNPCTGDEACRVGRCVSAAPVACDDEQTCVVRGSDATCETLCPLPAGPAIDVLRDDEVLRWADHPVMVATMPASAPLPDPVPWTEVEQLPLADHDGEVRLLARRPHAACDPDDPDDWADQTYLVLPDYPHPDAPAAPPPVAADDPRIVGWGSRVVAFTVGEAVEDIWLDPSMALGPAEGDGLSVLPLGRGGQVTLAIEPPIHDGPGPDLAVFENGFSDGFLELARVEVSSDGHTFLPFAGVAHTPEPVGAYEPMDPASVHGFAGVWAAGLGAPFDLALLRQHPLVRAGQVDLDRIRYVRLVDVVGDGSDLDAFGRPIHDPWPTSGTAGFDLDGIAVLEAR